MADERLFHFLTQIYRTNSAEIDCRQLQAFLPAYVEYDLSAGSGSSDSAIVEEQLAAIQSHLAHCPDCDDVYEGLRQVVLLTADGELLDVENLLSGFVERHERKEHAKSQSHGDLVRYSR